MFAHLCKILKNAVFYCFGSWRLIFKYGRALINSRSDHKILSPDILLNHVTYYILFQIKASSLDNLKQEIIQSFDLDPMSALMLAYCGKKLTELPRGKV